MRTKEELITFLKEELPLLTGKLTADSKPLWGTMDAQRMIEHLALAVTIANGKLLIPESAINARAAKFKVISLLSDRPLPKDFNNPILKPGLQPYKHASLEKAIENLFEELDAFHTWFSSDEQVTLIHNIFGHLSYHEWLWFQYKHMMHHLMQFGVVPLSDRIN